MDEQPGQRLTIDVAWASLWKPVGVIAMVWLIVELHQLILLVLLAILVAVASNPVVTWLEHTRLPRWAAAVLVCLVPVGIVSGFLVATWSSLSNQASTLTQRLESFEEAVLRALPEAVRDAFGGQAGDLAQSYIGPAALQAVRSISEAGLMVLLALILTLYFLLEGRRTFRWCLAFVPDRHRAHVQQTARDCERVVSAYVVGNMATSVFAMTFVWCALSILHVPATLLLAVLAGVCDFIPIVGFIASSVPALVLALGVSTNTAIAVGICYVAYHAAENYLIAPMVYGARLHLSKLAVLLAFAVGVEVAGVIGALVAVPLAAVYPSLERIWLGDHLPEGTLREHRTAERAG